MKFSLILFIISVNEVWAIEEGILKLNQTVLPEMIVADRRGDGAVTINEVIQDVKSFMHPSSHTQERDSLDTIERPSLESISNEASTVSTHPPCKPVWAVDLSESSMDDSDFNRFMNELSPDLGQLQILILSSVWLNDESWDILLSLLQRENFKYLDVSGVSHYSNRRIKPILERGKLLYPDICLNLSCKLIFSCKTYVKRLKEDIQWVQLCVDEGILHENWDEAHKNYYKDPKIKQIKEAQALNLLTGDDEVDVNFEIGDASFSDEYVVVDRIKALSLEDASSW